MLHAPVNALWPVVFKIPAEKGKDHVLDLNASHLHKCRAWIRLLWLWGLALLCELSAFGASV